MAGCFLSNFHQCDMSLQYTILQAGKQTSFNIALFYPKCQKLGAVPRTYYLF